MNKTLSRLASLIFFLTAISPSLIFAAGERTLHIYYTGNGNGEIEPCGCSPKASYGGLKRRGQFFHSLPDTEKGVIIETGNFAPENDDEQGRLKFELILGSMKALNYDVIAVKEREKKFTANLNDFSKRHKVPVISDASPHFPSTFYKEVNGTAIFVYAGVNALTTDSLTKSGLHILLVNKKELTIMNGSEFAPLVDLTINTGNQYSGAHMTGFVQAAINREDGQTIGHLTLTLNGDNTIKSYREEQILLTPDIEDDPAIVPLFDTYNKRVASYFEKKSREQKHEKGIFLGDENCKTCHEPFWNEWKKTPHSRAWQTLLVREKTSDPDCLPCHTVGYGKSGGFISRKRSPGLTNVQCEVCHGPGGSHQVNFSKRLPQVTEKICVECHNKKHSPDFDFQEYFKKIVH